MARKISIGELAGKATLNAQPYIDALKQAERETKKSTEKASGFFDRMGNEFRRKWTRPGMFKDILQGVGIGGGFAAAQTAASTIAGQWEKAAEMAKKVEDSTARQLKFTQDAIKAKQTDIEREAWLKNEISRTASQLKGWQSSKHEFNALAPGTWAQSLRNWINDTDKSDLATETILGLTEELMRLGVELDQLQKRLGDSRTAKGAAATDAYANAMKRLVAAEQEYVEIMHGERPAEQRRQIINVLAKEIAMYDRQLRDSTLPIEQRAVIVKKLADAMQTINPLIERNLQLGKAMGATIAESFEEAVFAGQKLSSTLNALLKDLARLAMREWVTAPMASWLGGILGPLFGGSSATKAPGVVAPTGSAIGGPVTFGEPYIVGERGPELFVPSTAGRIETNASLGKGGGNFYIDARGADRTGLAQLEAMIAALHGSIEPRAVAAVVDAQRRRLMPAV